MSTQVGLIIATVSCAVPTQPIARLINVTKAFGETLAVDDLCLDIFRQQVLGVVGPNGSGKSTLASILCGYLAPDFGRIEVGGEAVNFGSTADAISHGVRMLPQALEIYPSLTVLENIFLGQEITRRVPFLRLMAWKSMELSAKALLDRVDASPLSPRSIASRLSGGQQKAVVLARVLANPTNILVFDEPAASLGVRQKIRLLEIMRAEAADGRAVILISHDIDDVLSVCDRVVILRRGQLVADVNRRDTDRESLSSHMSMV